MSDVYRSGTKPAKDLPPIPPELRSNASAKRWPNSPVKLAGVTINGEYCPVLSDGTAGGHRVSWTEGGLIQIEPAAPEVTVNDTPVAHGIEQLPARGVIRDAWGRVGELTDRGVHWVRNSIPTTRDAVVFPATILEWGGR